MSAATPEKEVPWWLGDALTVGPDGLMLDGRPLFDIAAAHGTPVYVYGAATLRRRFAELRAALHSTGAPARIHYAMKANRFPGVLAAVRGEADIGIDACSPREVEHALAAGFGPAEISVTAGMLSDRDLRQFAAQAVHLNLDTQSAIRRYAAIAGPGHRIGLRIDPMVRIGWGQASKLCYGQGKFGFDAEAALAAAQYAAALGLEVDELHLHAGWGLQQSAAPLLGTAFAKLAELSRALPTVRTLNVGGGLCWRQRAADEPLALPTWTELLRRHLVPTGCTIACEPGTFVTASCGVLLAQVNTVESRRSGRWVGIDAGHNINCYVAHYGIPLVLAALKKPLDPPEELVHIAGNINEANDVFARSLALPRLAEGDLMALYPVGAYGASMASDHCLRGLPAEVMV